MPGVDLVDERRQQSLRRLRPVAASRALFGYLKDALLGAVDELACGQSLVAEHRGCDVGARADELPQERTLANDAGIGAHVGGRGRIAHQSSEIGNPTPPPEKSRALQLLGHRYGIAGLAGAGEGAYRLKDLPMVGTIEVAGAHDVGDIFPEIGRASCRERV